jgi:hypothetical protein
LTKEEKIAEMARRKEERKQVSISLLKPVLVLNLVTSKRIALLKEQKKNAAR